MSPRGCVETQLKGITGCVGFRHAVELLKNDHPLLAAGDGCVVRKGHDGETGVAEAADDDDQQTWRDGS